MSSPLPVWFAPFGWLVLMRPWLWTCRRRQRHAGIPAQFARPCGTAQLAARPGPGIPELRSIRREAAAYSTLQQHIHHLMSPPLWKNDHGRQRLVSCFKNKNSTGSLSDKISLIERGSQSVNYGGVTTVTKGPLHSQTKRRTTISNIQ